MAALWGPWAATRLWIVSENRLETESNTHGNREANVSGMAPSSTEQCTEHALALLYRLWKQLRS